MKSTTRRTCNAFTKSNAKRTRKPWYAIGARGGCLPRPPRKRNPPVVLILRRVTLRSGSVRCHPALAEVGHLLINWEIGQVGE